MTVFLFDIQQLNQDAFQIKPFMLLTLEDTVIYGETDWLLQHLLYAASNSANTIWNFVLK